VKIRLQALDRFLQRAERAVALLDRCRPLNFRTESARLLGAWRAGEALAPEFRYASPPDLSELRARLLLVARSLPKLGFGALYAERALELESEARTVEAIGRPEFRGRALIRFHLSDAEERTALARAERLCARGLGVAAARAAPVHRSDDEDDPGSLICCLQRAVGSLRLPVRIELVPDLVSAAAATNDGRLWVRAGVLHTDTEVKRIVLHELEGHVLPRLRALRESLGLFAVGTARGSDDEEGRALVLEERAGLFSAERGFELGLRHRAAASVRAGADFVETARLLVDQGASLEEAVPITARVFRGGGLAREVVYLTAYERVLAAFDERPELERWLERGRISVEAARHLERLGSAPELLEIEVLVPRVQRSDGNFEALDGARAPKFPRQGFA